MSQTYNIDIPLFKRLDWDTFTFEDDNVFRYVGQFQVNEKLIQCYVACCPDSSVDSSAQFWKFEIYPITNEIDFNFKKNDGAITIKTGAGTLEDYWEKIVKVANGEKTEYNEMFVREAG